MGVCVGDLEQRQMERLRVELGEVLAAHVAYPPFFNYRAAQPMVRPLDRTKRDEIAQYLRSVNFTPIERVDVASPEVRRFLERLILRYIEVNPALAKPRLYRRLPELRSRAPRMAAEVQRGLLALLSGQTTTFGTQRARPAWSGPAAQPHHLKQDREHNTRVLEAILVRRTSGALPPPQPSRPAASAPSPSAQASAPVPAPSVAHSWPAAPTDLTVPVPAQGMPVPSPVPTPGPYSPFAGLEAGAQSDVFGSVSDNPTGPLVPPRPAASAAPSSPASYPPQRPSVPHAPGNMRELPPDLLQLYGDYLADMEPEAGDAPAAPPDQPTAAVPVPYAGAGAGAPGPIVRPVANDHATRAASANGAAGQPADAASARGDKLIFWQMRYQLEAYVRRAARSYGVHTTSGDPSGVIDALRRSGFVDEADLRIAEGILALTDRVTAGVTPSIEDYRQALMLYLLYHRSHLGT